MRVLVVVGSNLKINTSANLCHKAYIQGLLENGYHVDMESTVRLWRRRIQAHYCL